VALVIGSMSVVVADLPGYMSAQASFGAMVVGWTVTGIGEC
jgi:hypothetical protein